MAFDGQTLEKTWKSMQTLDASGQLSQPPKGDENDPSVVQSVVNW